MKNINIVFVPKFTYMHVYHFSAVEIQSVFPRESKLLVIAGIIARMEN